MCVCVCVYECVFLCIYVYQKSVISIVDLFSVFLYLIPVQLSNIKKYIYYSLIKINTFILKHSAGTVLR